MASVWAAGRSLAAEYTGFERAVYIVGAGQFVNVFGGGVVYPFAALYFVETVGLPFSLIGAGLLANSVFRAVGTAVGGYLADRAGRVPTMVASMALSAIALAAYALVTTVPGFVIVASAAGLVGGLYTPASHALVADLTTGGERERAYGLLKVANNAGFGLGFVAGGLLFGLAKAAVFIVDGATSGVVAVLLYLALDHAEPVRSEASLYGELTRWVGAVGEPRLVHLAVLNVGFAVLYAQMQSTVPVFATRAFDLSSAQLGTLYVLNPLVLVVFQLPVVARVAGWRRTRGLVLSTAFWAASFGAIILAHFTTVLLGIALVGAFLVLRTIGEVLHSPLATALASDLGPAETSGSQLSVVEISKRLGFGAGNLVGGAFFDYGIEPWLWPAMVVLALGLGLGVLALECRLSPAENGVSPG